MAMDSKILLLIEDEVEVASLIEEALLGLCEVQTVKSLEEAREQISSQVFDLILADRQLPDGDGIELLESMQETKNQNVPFMFLTGMIDEDSKIEGLVTNAVDYIEKPFSPRELRVRIARTLKLN